MRYANILNSYRTWRTAGFAQKDTLSFEKVVAVFGNGSLESAIQLFTRAIVINTKHPFTYQNREDTKSALRDNSRLYQEPRLNPGIKRLVRKPI
jgi:hypothetical protein